jgi:hypothetical protein
MIQPLETSDNSILEDIPETATKFKYGNMIIAMLHTEKKKLIKCFTAIIPLVIFAD